MWAILSDAAAACVLSVLPEHLSELGVYICLFAMGFQWCVFAGKDVYKRQVHTSPLTCTSPLWTHSFASPPVSTALASFRRS